MDKQFLSYAFVPAYFPTIWTLQTRELSLGRITPLRPIIIWICYICFYPHSLCGDTTRCTNSSAIHYEIYHKCKMAASRPVCVMLIPKFCGFYVCPQNFQYILYILAQCAGVTNVSATAVKIYSWNRLTTVARYSSASHKDYRLVLVYFCGLHN